MTSSKSQSIKTWVEHDPTEYSTLPDAPAVYVVLLDGQPMYVGQTTRLRQRFNNYRMRWGYGGGVLTPWGQFDGTVSIKFSHGWRYGDWAMRELRLIRRLRPPWNCLGSTATQGTPSRPRRKTHSQPRTTNSFVDQKYRSLKDAMGSY